MKVKTKAAPDFSDRADQLAKEYLAAKEAENTAGAAAASANKEIKELAETEGIQDGTYKLVTGDHYKVGFQLVGGGSQLNQGKAKLKLAPSVWEKLRYDAIDPQKLTDAVSAGLVSQKLYMELMDEKPPTKKIIVQHL